MTAFPGSALRWAGTCAIGLLWALREALALWRVRGARR